MDYLNSLVGQDFEMVSYFERHKRRLHKSKDQRSFDI